MARPNLDIGKPDDTSIKDILSPWDSDGSAVADTKKLLRFGPPVKSAMLIYGFDDDDRPLDRMIDAFEVLASRAVVLGQRQTSELGALVHPAHSRGKVFGWEVGAADQPGRHRGRAELSPIQRCR